MRGLKWKKQEPKEKNASVLKLESPQPKLRKKELKEKKRSVRRKLNENKQNVERRNYEKKRNENEQRMNVKPKLRNVKKEKKAWLRRQDCRAN